MAIKACEWKDRQKNDSWISDSCIWISTCNHTLFLTWSSHHLMMNNCWWHHSPLFLTSKIYIFLLTYQASLRPLKMRWPIYYYYCVLSYLNFCLQMTRDWIEKSLKPILLQTIVRSKNRRPSLCHFGLKSNPASRGERSDCFLLKKSGRPLSRYRNLLILTLQSASVLIKMRWVQKLCLY